MDRNLFHLGLISALALAGCGRTGMPASDGSAAPPGEAGVPPQTCSTLSLVGQAQLGSKNTAKLTPRVAFDGEHFAVIWHTQPLSVSSLNGELRMARVSLKASTGLPFTLGTNNGALPHALLGVPGELALVHLPTATSGLHALERRLMDPAGNTRHSTSIAGSYRHAALAPHPTGHAVLLSPVGGLPRIVVVDRGGKTSEKASILTAQIMASLWIGAGPGGWGALLHSTNSNGMLHTFDHQLKAKKMGSIGKGALIRSPSMVVAPGGYAALYSTSWAGIYSELLDSSGKSTGRNSLGSAGWANNVTGITALVHTGHNLAAIYPSGAKGQFMARLLPWSTKSAFNDFRIKVPNCLTSGSEVHAAFGKGHLAVAALERASSSIETKICVSVFKCR